MKLKHKDVTEKIIGVFFDVYNELGYGFLESVYEKAMAVALEEAGLQCETQAQIQVLFRDRAIGDFKADIVVEDSVIIELKCARTINDAHIAQALNYLKATRIEVALILNFGPKPEFKRVAFDQDRSVRSVESAAKKTNE